MKLEGGVVAVLAATDKSDVSDGSGALSSNNAAC